MKNLIRIAARIATDAVTIISSHDDIFNITSAVKMNDGGYKVRISDHPDDDHGSIEASIYIETFNDKGQTFLGGMTITDIKGPQDTTSLEKWVSDNEDSIADKIWTLTQK